MHALFVHGMGRSRLSGWRLLARLRAHGIIPQAFGYTTPFESFDSIRARLTRRIIDLAAEDDYVLIGHSLGGVLIRGALAGLPTASRPPHRIFLLGSPTKAAMLARKLAHNVIFRMLAGDCGQLLASPTRMASVASTAFPTTNIIGTSGWKGRLNPFQGEPNDGIVAVSEVSAAWSSEQRFIPAIHTYLPSNREVSRLILTRIAGASNPD